MAPTRSKPAARVLIALLPLGAACLPRGSVSVEKTTSVAHPSGRGALAPNAIEELGGEAGPVRTRRWLSLTTLTSERVCVDVVIEARSWSDGAAERFIAEQLEHDRTYGGMQFHSARNHSVQPTSRTEFPATFLRRENGTRNRSREVDRGSTEKVCAEPQYQNGKRYGCARWAAKPVLDTVWDTVPAVWSYYRGGTRWCARNDGLVASDSDVFDVSPGNPRFAERRRFRLTSGRAVAGRWGASGGTAIDGADSPPRPGAVEDPPPVATATRDEAPTTAQTPPRPPASPLASRADAELAIVPLRIDNAKGKIVAELRADGTVTFGGTVAGKISAEGLVTTAAGVPVMALDRRGRIWSGTRAPLTEQATIAGGTMQMTDGSAIKGFRDGRFRYTSRGETATSRARIQPRSAARSPLGLLLAKLALTNLELELEK